MNRTDARHRARLAWLEGRIPPARRVGGAEPAEPDAEAIAETLNALFESGEAALVRQVVGDELADTLGL